MCRASCPTSDIQVLDYGGVRQSHKHRNDPSKPDVVVNDSSSTSSSEESTETIEKRVDDVEPLANLKVKNAKTSAVDTSLSATTSESSN